MDAPTLHGLAQSFENTPVEFRQFVEKQYSAMGQRYFTGPWHAAAADQISRYRGKLSGPLLDRIDLQIEVPALPAEALQGAPDGEASAIVRGRVIEARNRQLQRQNKPNARLAPREVDLYCQPDESGAALLKNAVTRLNLSARAYHRILRVARSIADLAGSAPILPPHIAEAIQYRRFTKE